MPYIVAHRGYKARYPENTMAAFKAAIASGAHAIECDVQFSRDRVPVIIHDVDLSRTTGDQGRVFDYECRYLMKIAADKEMVDEWTDDINIPQLSELLELISQYPAVKLFVEIKAESLNYFGMDVVMKALETMLQPFNAQCVIISYEVLALEHVRQHSSLGVGWVLYHYDDTHHQMALDLKPDYLICNHTKLSLDQMPWQGPWQWMLYEINDASLAECWIKSGIDYIETASVSTLRQSALFSSSPMMSKSE
jgi:glycerophosphoryl diester phosphodiesterase